MRKLVAIARKQGLIRRENAIVLSICCLCAKYRTIAFSLLIRPCFLPTIARALYTTNFPNDKIFSYLLIIILTIGIYTYIYMTTTVWFFHIHIALLKGGCGFAHWGGGVHRPPCCHGRGHAPSPLYLLDPQNPAARSATE